MASNIIALIAAASIEERGIDVRCAPESWIHRAGRLINSYDRQVRGNAFDQRWISEGYVRAAKLETRICVPIPEVPVS
jgi:hypothetical protein